jgi:hypothetical protein
MSATRRAEAQTASPWRRKDRVAVVETSQALFHPAKMEGQTAVGHLPKKNSTTPHWSQLTARKSRTWRLAD